MAHFSDAGTLALYTSYQPASNRAGRSTRNRLQAQPRGARTIGELNHLYLGTASGNAYGESFIERNAIVQQGNIYDDDGLWSENQHTYRNVSRKFSNRLEGDLELGDLHEEGFELKDARSFSGDRMPTRSMSKPDWKESHRSQRKQAQRSAPAAQPCPSKDENGRRRSMPIVAGGAWSNTTTASRSYSPSGRPRASPTGTSSSSAGGLHTAGTFINTTFMIVLGIAGIVIAILSYQLGKYTAKQGDQSYKLAMWEACVEHADILRNSTRCRKLIAEGFDTIFRGKKVRMKG